VSPASWPRGKPGRPLRAMHGRTWPVLSRDLRSPRPRMRGGRAASSCASMRLSATVPSRRGQTRTPGGTDATVAAMTG
jgi:hypothetical protein